MAWGVDATIRWRHNIFVLRCGDVANPVLGMKQGVTYTFDQSLPRLSPSPYVSMAHREYC